jgi:hypothetical protein
MRGHETEDADVRKIFRLAGAFIALGAVIYVLVWFMFGAYRTRNAQRDVRQTLIEAPVVLPPEPRLQVNPQLDWQEYRRAQQNMLGTYGWVSREQRMARIPIGRAMEMVVEGGNRNGTQ